MMLIKANIAVDEVYEEFHRIDIIMKGRFQRRVRKVWFEYKKWKAEEAEKKRLAKEAKAKANKFKPRKTALV